MFSVHVFAQVKEEYISAFKQATIENAENSLREEGIARFDVAQQQDNPQRFVLVEVYRSEEDPARHKQTSHYKKWRDTVAEMMAEPRASIRYDNIYP